MSLSDSSVDATVSFSLNGREVSAGPGESILQVARREEIEIPHLCYADGLAASRRLLSGAERPDAIFAANDVMALAVIDVARSEFGLQIPGDLAVVGFDDIGVAAHAAYDLTTVHQPVAAMIDAAADMMQELLADPSRRPSDRRLASRLVIRGSARPPHSQSNMENVA